MGSVGRALRRVLALLILGVIRVRWVFFPLVALAIVGFAAWTYTHREPPPTTAPAKPGTAEAAIQQVIQRADAEQAQALASKDPTVMRDTATPTYYQSAVQINQQLIDGGVKSVKLEKIEWGPVTVDGDQATAIAFETWTTSYADGTTDQYRDRNLYRLVRQNNRWLIEADEHPDQPTPAPGQGGPPVVVVTPSR